MSSHRPNIILIMTDQQRLDSLGCYGNKFVETPNIDRLAQSGARFDKCFTPWPVCSPARATMWTGVYPHTHGVVENVYNMDDALETVSSLSTTVFDLLREEKGYTTAYFGKWHLGDKNPGTFDIWEGFNSLGGHWVNGTIGGDYKPDVQTDQCIQFIKQAKQNKKPFIMVQGYYPPHDPLTAPQPFFEPYRGKGVPFPGYYAAVSNIDYNVGRIIKAFNNQGLREDTLVIFFSDHGDTFKYREEGEHKFVCFDEAIRIPFIVSWPHHIKPGTVLDCMAGLEDLMPTILDLAGCSFPEYLPGRSLCSWFEGKTPSDWRSFYYVENITYHTHRRQRCIRTDKWKLILGDGGIHAVRIGPHSLYNLEDDPEEEIDVFDTSRDDFKLKQMLSHMPGYQQQITKLATLLQDYAHKIGDSFGVRLAGQVLGSISKKR